MTMWMVGVASGLAALAAASAPAGPGPPPLAFAGVALGSSEAAWRALQPPGAASPQARHICSDDPGPAAAQLADQAAPKGAVVCAIMDVYGRTAVPATVSWNGRYPVDHLRFVFTHGVLSQVRARLPIDAFDALMADFRRAYGPPSRTVRDTLRTEIGRQPRVTQVWTLPQGRIEMVDPVATEQLSVRMTAAGESRS